MERTPSARSWAVLCLGGARQMIFRLQLCAAAATVMIIAVAARFLFTLPVGIDALLVLAIAAAWMFGLDRQVRE